MLVTSEGVAIPDSTDIVTVRRARRAPQPPRATYQGVKLQLGKWLWSGEVRGELRRSSGRAISPSSRDPPASPRLHRRLSALSLREPAQYANEYPAVPGLRGRLRPTPEVESWEQQFHDVAGPHVRRLAYFYLFQDIDRIRDLLRITMPGWQATFGILTLPLLRGPSSSSSSSASPLHGSARTRPPTLAARRFVLWTCAGAIFRLLNVNERASARSLVRAAHRSPSCLPMSPSPSQLPPSPFQLPPSPPTLFPIAIALCAFSLASSALQEKVQEQFRVASEHLDAQKAAGRVDATGQPFFVGTEFTAADLTWASLVAPILVIQPEEGLNIGLPKLETAGTPEFRDLVRQLRGARSERR